MLPITMKLLEQRLKEVDAEILRASLLPSEGGHAKSRIKIVNQLKSYRQQVVKELETVEEM